MFLVNDTIFPMISFWWCHTSYFRTFRTIWPPRVASFHCSCLYMRRMQTRWQIYWFFHKLRAHRSLSGKYLSNIQPTEPLQRIELLRVSSEPVPILVWLLDQTLSMVFRDPLLDRPFQIIVSDQLAPLLAPNSDVLTKSPPCFNFSNYHLRPPCSSVTISVGLVACPQDCSRIHGLFRHVPFQYWEWFVQVVGGCHFLSAVQRGEAHLGMGGVCGCQLIKLSPETYVAERITNQNNSQMPYNMASSYFLSVKIGFRKCNATLSKAMLYPESFIQFSLW